MHEIFVHQFDDGSTDNGYETAIVPYTGGDVNYDLNVHDIDTDIDELMSFEVNQAQRGSSSRSFPNSNFGNRSNGYNNRIINVRMSRETWEKLIKKDQESWDLISDSGKQTILNYVRNDRFKNTPKKPSDNLKLRNNT